MNRVEKFGLWTGIIGLISDTIALITFFAGYWGNPTTTAVAVPATATAQGTTFTITTYEIPLVIRTIIILTLIYSWAAISWVLVRRSFRLRKYREPRIITDIMFRAVSGIGILVLPVFMMWMITYRQDGVPTRNEAVKVLAEFQARNPGKEMCLGGSGSIEGEDCIWDQSDAAFWAVPVSFIFQAIFIAILWLVFYLLVPVVYPDMSAEEIAYELGLAQPPTLAESAGVEEAVTKIVPMRSNTKTK